MTNKTMNSVQRAKMMKFIARKNPFDEITITSDTMHPAKIRIGWYQPWRDWEPKDGYFVRVLDHPGYEPTPDDRGDADDVEEWLENAYAMQHTVRYTFAYDETAE